MQREGERCGAVDFLLLTAIFSVWIFLFKKIYVGNNLECKCAAQIGAVSLDSRLLQTEERGDGREAPFFGHTHSHTLGKAATIKHFWPTLNRKNMQFRFNSTDILRIHARSLCEPQIITNLRPVVVQALIIHL